MANTNAPFGLRPVRYLNGTPWNGQVRQYYIPATDGTALYRGDPVVLAGSSNSTELFGCQPGSLSSVTLATAGDTPGTGTFITGVFWGSVPVTAESKPYREASTERVIYVIDDPDIIFEIQDDGSAALVAGTVGLNAVLKSGTGSAGTGLSGWTLDANGDPPAADASNQLLIQALSKKQNNALGIYAIWDVTINAHTQVRPALGIA